MSSGSRSSVQNAIRAGPNSCDERQQRLEVARHRRLADQQPHAGAEPLPTLLDRERLVVGADAGGGVRVQRLAEHAGRMPVDVLGAVERELRELGRIAGDDAGEVHHLGEADHAPAPEQPLEVARPSAAAAATRTATRARRTRP